MIDTEHVKCDTCTAPEPMELDASDEASRGWPTVDIETNPYKGQFPLFQQHSQQRHAVGPARNGSAQVQSPARLHSRKQLLLPGKAFYFCDQF